MNRTQRTGRIRRCTHHLARIRGRCWPQALFLGPELHAAPAALALGDVHSVTVAAANLVEDRLAR